MNETRQLMFGLKMSPAPEERTRVWTGFPTRVEAWETAPTRFTRKAATALVSAFVTFSSLVAALFPSLPTLSSCCTQGSLFLCC